MKKFIRFLVLGLLVVIIFCSIYLTVRNVKLNHKYQVNIKDTNVIPVNKEDKIKNLSIVMIGDVLIHKSLFNEARTDDDKYDFGYMFEKVRNLFNGYDLRFYNQESIIGGESFKYSGYPRFNSPKEIGNEMLSMGFNLVSLANNHALDKGERGILNSMNYWETKPVVTAGTYSTAEEKNTGEIYVKNGIKYAFLAYTERTNGLKAPEGKEYLVSVYSDKLAYDDIMKIKDTADLIIVSMHWGTEYSNVPNDSQKRIAAYLSSLGVDIIVGHHPHVIQPIELVNNTLVFYSLGNFISGQDSSDKLTGLVASINIKFIKENNVLKKEIDSINAELVYTYHKSFKNYKVIPYNQLTSKEFSKYKKYYKKYYKILTSKNDRVIVTNLDE